MSTGWIITLIVIGVLVAILVVLYFLGKKAQKKQAEQQVLLEQNKQTVSMLIIDKKRMKMKDSGLPPWSWSRRRGSCATPSFPL